MSHCWNNVCAMKLTLDQRFYDVMEEVSNLFRRGHCAKADEICSLAETLCEDELALRYFTKSALTSSEKRKLSAAQSFLVYSCAEFVTRINLWFPNDARVPERSIDDLRQYFSYNLCHNHNYDFFTVCLLGSGYAADFFTASQDLTSLKAGDEVVPDIEWSMKLPKGASLFVPKDTHFHTQFEPESFSVTLNLVPVAPTETRQYLLHQNSRRVQRIIEPVAPSETTKVIKDLVA